MFGIERRNLGRHGSFIAESAEQRGAVVARNRHGSEGGEPLPCSPADALP